AVSVLGGTVTGGTGAGVQIVGGATNSIVNQGKITSSSGNAILSDVGNETLDNSGTITGLTNLGDGNNTIKNSGTMTANSPVISTGSGDDIVNNSGTITGDVNLDGGVNAFNNLTAGLFNAGTKVSLGANTNVFTNDGTFAPGGAGTIQTTSLTGKF